MEGDIARMHWGDEMPQRECQILDPHKIESDKMAGEIREQTAEERDLMLFGGEESGGAECQDGPPVGFSSRPTTGRNRQSRAPFGSRSAASSASAAGTAADGLAADGRAPPPPRDAGGDGDRFAPPDHKLLGDAILVVLRVAVQVLDSRERTERERKGAARGCRDDDWARTTVDCGSALPEVSQPPEGAKCELELRLGSSASSGGDGDRSTMSAWRFSTDIGESSARAVAAWARSTCSSTTTSRSRVDILEPIDVEGKKLMPDAASSFRFAARGCVACSAAPSPGSDGAEVCATTFPAMLRRVTWESCSGEIPRQSRPRARRGSPDGDARDGRSTGDRRRSGATERSRSPRRSGDAQRERGPREGTYDLETKHRACAADIKGAFASQLEREETRVSGRRAAPGPSPSARGAEIDVRIALNYETPVRGDLARAECNAKRSRVRNRTSYWFSRDAIERVAGPPGGRPGDAGGRLGPAEAIASRLTIRVDATEVESIDGTSSPGRIEHECEFEVGEGILECLRAASIDERPAACAACADRIARFIVRAVVAAEMHARHPGSVDYFWDVVDEGRGAAPRRPADYGIGEGHFSGTMPRNMHRSDLAEIVAATAAAASDRVRGTAVSTSPAIGGFYASEKTDGVRHLLIIDGGALSARANAAHRWRPMAYIVDRSLAIRGIEMPRAQFVQLARASDRAASRGRPPIDGPPAPTVDASVTVLDGELCRDLASMEPVFLAFDVVVLDGIDVSGATFDARRRALEAYVDEISASPRSRAAGTADDEEERPGTRRPGPLRLSRRRSDAPRSSGGPASSPGRDALRVATKSIVDASMIDVLLERVVRGADGCAIFACEGYATKIDGFVFARAAAPYRAAAGPGAPPASLKWKYPGRWTIDVRVASVADPTGGSRGDGRGPRIAIAARSTDGASSRTIPIATIELDGSAGSAPQDLVGSIIEVAIDPASGRWKFFGTRADKSDSNNVFVAFDTLCCAAEGVSLDEIRALCAAGR